MIVPWEHYLLLLIAQYNCYAHLVALVVGHALEALGLGVEVALLAAVRLNKV